MRPSVLNQNNISPELAGLITRLVSLIPWPERRQAMGDTVITILDGKPRVAENEFGWNRSAVALGIKEFESGIVCLNDLTKRHKLKSEEKNPDLLTSIRKIIDPYSQTEQPLQKTALYAKMTAQSVYNALIAEGWPEESLPTVRTLSNILKRNKYRL